MEYCSIIRSRSFALLCYFAFLKQVTYHSHDLKLSFEDILQHFVYLGRLASLSHEQHNINYFTNY